MKLRHIRQRAIFIVKLRDRVTTLFPIAKNIKLSRRVTLGREIFASQTLLTATSASRFDSKGEKGSTGLSREILESLDPRFLAELYGILR